MSRSILKDYAQAIVETTHSIIGYDILITDNRGVIIGTNDLPRMGTMHAHSLRVIARGLPETAGNENLAFLMRPGWSCRRRYFIGRIRWLRCLQLLFLP